jgi:LEA14-like dessication related protein
MNTKYSFKGRRLFLIFFLLAALSACTSNQDEQNSKVELKKVRIAQVTADAVYLEGTLEIFNPNDKTLRFSGYDYQLSVEGRRLISGESDKPFEIAAQTWTRINLPATVRFEDLKALAAKDPFSRDIAYRFWGTVHLQSFFGSVPLAFSQQGTFNLSEYLREKAKELLPRF